jgi:precorrin-6B methylase 2
VKPKAGEIFWDLGCGAGKPMTIASLCFPELKGVFGVEILEGLSKIALNMSELIKSISESSLGKGSISPISII